MPKKTQKAVRSAVNGRYLPKAAAKRDPERTVTETRKRVTKKSR